MLLERKKKEVKAQTQFKKQTFEAAVVNRDNSSIGASCSLCNTGPVISKLE
jgi:hypothetical protein